MLSHKLDSLRRSVVVALLLVAAPVYAAKSFSFTKVTDDRFIVRGGAEMSSNKAMDTAPSVL